MTTPSTFTHEIFATILARRPVLSGSSWFLAARTWTNGAAILPAVRADAKDT
jgi:hypothetical protein